ncbi:helix-turn-helix transcriptional regulator [Streptomyces sp. DG2A-72]|uniref:telomere-protecting terminal protein Tpg n=1 Tax=Streptomyces sp. DG2A-72 TaxID=3051386 RepID=UPI00265BB56A|nr:helix-turn-helix transcriptional regulator [Streptomyces sp. DG2A-72]MDO0939285.1 helix-turn-helix transcriptional regulator [Streptomyces sp. DG2A-72]
MGKVVDALRARIQTRDLPKTPKGLFNALMRREKGNTQRVADRLGISRRQVQRIVKGDRDIRKSKAETLDALRREVSKDHQPRVTAKGIKDAKSRGLTIETRASFGFHAAAGSTDDARMRRLTEDVPEELLDDLFEALRNGDEEKAQEIAGEALAMEYFRDGGTRADGLDVTFSDIDYIDFH